MTYEEFKELMDDELIPAYQGLINEIKDILKDFDWKDALENANKFYALFIVAAHATSDIAADLEELDEDTQVDYLAHYLDDMFKFKEYLLEKFDREVFKFLLNGLIQAMNLVLSEEYHDQKIDMPDVIKMFINKKLTVVV